MRKPIKIGTQEHKEHLCGFFMESFIKFEPKELPWPKLEGETLERLRSLPVWEEAVTTEAETAMKVVALGKAEKDPLLAEAISLQGYEEERHAETLRLLTERYGIKIKRRPDLSPPRDPHWTFMRVGYGECFDSFFGFGLFALAKDSGFFPPSIVDIFEPIMQEEARHIIFIANWLAYCQAQLPSFKRPGYVFNRGLALWLQSVGRIKTAMRLKDSQEVVDVDQENFMMSAHRSFGDFSVKDFLRTCISEHDRRVKPYDSRLLRPKIVPGIARGLLGLGIAKGTAGGKQDPKKEFTSTV